MKIKFTTIFLLCAVALGLVMSGCGSSGSGGIASAPGTTNTTVSGVASLNSASGTVSIKDSSAVAQEKTTSITSNGSYAIDVTGLQAPFMLKATWSDATGTNQIYSMSASGGKTNINTLSDAAMTGAGASNGMDSGTLYAMRSGENDYRRTSVSFESIINQLRTVLAPLFALYNVSGNGVDDDNESDNSGLQAMLNDVSITVKSGMVTVTNRQTGGLIFSGSVNNLSSGTFNQQNMPGGTGTSACTYTYSSWGACDSTGNQTRTMISSSPAGCTGTPILSQACVSTPPPPTTCTYNYSAWGACQSNNTQTRTVTSSSPAGCTGTPVLSQSCVYTPPVTTCTSFTYSAWGACQSNNTQTRTVATSSPAGCTGGSPVISQACTYVPPVTTCTSFTYSAWGACDSTGNQTRTVATSSPAGCTGGSPVLSQACTSNPVTLAMVQSTCTQCHGLTVNNTVFKAGGYTAPVGRTSAQWVTALTGMFSTSMLPAGTTIQNFADFLVTVP